MSCFSLERKRGEEERAERGEKGKGGRKARVEHEE